MAVVASGGAASTVGVSDGPNLDAFSRVRVSDPVTLFDSQLQYGTGGTFSWNQSITGTAAIAHSAASASATMTVNASGDVAIRQSKAYHRYQPGKSQIVAATFVMGDAVANVTRRVGYFDSENGIFLEQTGTDVAIVRRSNTTGTPTDTRVTQANWNLPAVAGVDLSKAQILIIDLQWLGVGRVRVGFDIDGVIEYVHEFRNANNLSTVYMTTANLPVRYEIRATGAISGAKTLHQICSMVMSEGGFEAAVGIPRSASNGITTIGVTTRRPVLSIRPAVTINSITNRGQIILEGVSLHATTNSAYWELVYNGTLTGASFASLGANSGAESDVAASAITGGEVIASGFIEAAASIRSSVSSRIVSRIPLTLDIAGTTATPLTLVVTSFTGTSNVSGEISFREIW